jgi:ketosteroid isomerase-like protein
MAGDDMGSNAAVIEQMYEAFGRGDIPAVVARLADDLVWSAPATLPQGGLFHGKAGAMTFFEGLGSAWERLGLDIEGLGEVGEDLVIALVRADGTLRGGGPGGYGAVHVFTLAGGQVTRFREYTDLGAPLG